MKSNHEIRIAIYKMDNEYQVQVKVFGQTVPKYTYFTDDKQDVMFTALDMEKRFTVMSNDVILFSKIKKDS